VAGLSSLDIFLLGKEGIKCTIGEVWKKDVKFKINLRL
jgi:hypothetical protein